MAILYFWHRGVCLLLHIFMDTFYSTILLPDLSPFGVVCSTVKSGSQRQKLSLKTSKIKSQGRLSQPWLFCFSKRSLLLTTTQ